ncbi:hypothetical protein O6H91_23G054600 [Diphasiastrum complanatum]|nr:hypothetical protein O6H91_23G054600 [Diphasiastrum complanatum]
MDGSRLGFEYEGPSLEKVYASARPNAETSSNDYLWKAPFMGIHAVEEERHELPVLQRGKLTVHIGDALGPEAMVDGGFAGIIVDLFSKGAVLPSLQQTETWERMKERLRPGGRIMVNCGGSCVESESKKGGGITMEETIATLARVFPRQLSKRVIRFNGDNCIALTGPIPDLRAWMRSLPKQLLRGVFDWETVEYALIDRSL